MNKNDCYHLCFRYWLIYASEKHTKNIEYFKFKFQISISHFSREHNAIKYLMIEIIIFIIRKVAYIRIESLNLSE